MRSFTLLLISCWLPLLAVGGSEQNDITFVVAGKTANFRQETNGDLAALNYHFFAEIFLQEHGLVESASILTPLSPTQAVAFTDSGYALEMHGGRYATERELETNYPDGNYIFRYTSPSTGSQNQIVALINHRSGSSGIPEPPQIKLYQGGSLVLPEEIDPRLDLNVTWSDFSDGDTDPLGIMNDLIFVIMGDCHGERKAHSGRPFENRPFLDYSATGYPISAAVLQPEQTYQISVEHAVLDTTIHNGVPGFATFATTTFQDIQTLGVAPVGEACTEILQKFDSGQTDLRRDA
ncbi:MAG: hypothetical protein ACI9GW_003600 [Halieaceae bacterium]|jgi:hypothetical protein